MNSGILSPLSSDCTQQTKKQYRSHIHTHKHKHHQLKGFCNCRQVNFAHRLQDAAIYKSKELSCTVATQTALSSCTQPQLSRCPPDGALTRLGDSGCDDCFLSGVVLPELLL